jgi:hypothetical protein
VTGSDAAFNADPAKLFPCFLAKSLGGRAHAGEVGLSKLLSHVLRQPASVIRTSREKLDGSKLAELSSTTLGNVRSATIPRPRRSPDRRDFRSPENAC